MHGGLAFFGQCVSWFFELLTMEFNIFGFNISFWQVIVFVIVTTVMFRIIAAVLFD